MKTAKEWREDEREGKSLIIAIKEKHEKERQALREGHEIQMALLKKGLGFIKSAVLLEGDLTIVKGILKMYRKHSPAELQGRLETLDELEEAQVEILERMVKECQTEAGLLEKNLKVITVSA